DPLDADGGRPRRPRRLPVGELHRGLRAPGLAVLRRPDGRLGGRGGLPLAVLPGRRRRGDREHPHPPRPGLTAPWADGPGADHTSARPSRSPLAPACGRAVIAKGEPSDVVTPLEPEVRRRRPGRVAGPATP